MLVHTHTGVHSSYRSGQEEVNSDSVEKASSKPPQESDRPPFLPFSAFTCFSVWLRSAQQKKKDQKYDIFLGQNGKTKKHMIRMLHLYIHPLLEVYLISINGFENVRLS